MRPERIHGCIRGIALDLGVTTLVRKTGEQRPRKEQRAAGRDVPLGGLRALLRSVARVVTEYVGQIASVCTVSEIVDLPSTESREKKLLFYDTIVAANTDDVRNICGAYSIQN